MKEKIDKAPRVTVLMPVYNGEQFLREAIDSILGQTFVDFEFLIINDGSSDASESLILSYCDSRIKLVQNETNLGLIATLNKGIRLARGEYIARMDCDDISLPQRLEKQVTFMDNHQEVGVCGSWIKVFGNIDIYDQRYPAKSDEIKALLFFHCALAHPSVMFRKNLFLENNLSYDSEYKHAEDYSLWTVISSITSLGNLQEVLLNYRITGQQSSALYRTEQIECSYKTMEIHLGRLGIFPTAHEKAIHRYFMLDDKSAPFPDIKDVEKWLSKIMNSNKQKHVFADPFFSDLIKRKWFRIVISCIKDHKVEAFKLLTIPVGVLWIIRSLITRKTVFKYL